MKEVLQIDRKLKRKASRRKKKEERIERAEIWVHTINYAPYGFSKSYMMEIKTITPSDVQDSDYKGM